MLGAYPVLEIGCLTNLSFRVESARTPCFIPEKHPVPRQTIKNDNLNLHTGSLGAREQFSPWNFSNAVDVRSRGRLREEHLDEGHQQRCTHRSHPTSPPTFAIDISLWRQRRKGYAARRGAVEKVTPLCCGCARTASSRPTQRAGGSRGPGGRRPGHFASALLCSSTVLRCEGKTITVPRKKVDPQDT